MSALQPNAARTIVVDPSLSEILRLQTLLVLQANHEPFEDIRYLRPDELVELAEIWRDAFDVLDTVGWLPKPGTATVAVPITAGHAAQLRHLRDDLASSVLDDLDVRDGLSTYEQLAEADAMVHARRLSAQGLGEILQLYYNADAL